MAEETKAGNWLPAAGRGRDILTLVSGVALTLAVPMVDSIGGVVLDRVADRLAERLKTLLPTLTPTPAKPTPTTPTISVTPATPTPATPTPAPSSPPSLPVPAPPAPPAPVNPPQSVDIIDSAKAAVRIHSGNSGCSGTLFRMDTSEQYWLLTCAHCVRNVGQAVNIKGDGFELRGQVERFDKRQDICLVRVDERSRKYAVAKIAETPPARGAFLWHKGYGMDQPGNIERGNVLEVGDSYYACWYTTRLSSGDSGSGQFLMSDGTLVALGAWGDRNRYGGASLLQIRAFLWPTGSSSPPRPPSWPIPQPPCPDGTCPPGWRTFPLPLDELHNF